MIEVTSLEAVVADGRTYERVKVTGMPEGGYLSVEPPSAESEETPLPVGVLVERAGALGNEPTLSYPCVPGREGSYRLAVLDRDLSPVASVERAAFSLPPVTTSERIKRKLRRTLGSEQPPAAPGPLEPTGPMRISIDRVIPCNTHIIVRGTVYEPEPGPHDVRLLCLDAGLARIGEKVIPMGERLVRSDPVSELHEYQYRFSVYLPWNQDVIHFVAWNEARPHYSAALSLPRSEWEAKVKETDWLFLHAGADPYYQEWFLSHRSPAWQLAAQRRAELPVRPLFSVIVPLFRTPGDLFEEMLRSVLDQTYTSWELVLVNASPEDEALAALVERACASDARVTSIALEKNGGISLNTNAGIAVAHGDFVCFFDHDDVIEPDLLFEYAKAIGEHNDVDVLYCDEDKLSPEGRYIAPYFKPDFNIDLLRCNNYVCHMLTIRRTLLERLKPNTPDYDGAQDHNLVLEASELARRIHHVPKVLYHWRITASSTAANADSKPYANAAGIKSVREHLERVGLRAEVELSRFPFTYAVRYLPPAPEPLVSVIIPTKDHPDVLSRCLDSVFEKTTYPNYEVVIVDNASSDPALPAYYDKLERERDGQVRVVRYDEPFNFSSIVNLGVRSARGDYLLLLNNDTEVITEQWMERMVGLCAREDVGAVGVRLYYPDDTIQHAGIVVTDKDAGHFCQDMPRVNNNWGYFNLGDCQRDLTAVTAACMMTTRRAFQSVGGFEEQLSVAFNDVDFCLKLRERGLLVVYTPEVELYHYESLSRGIDLTHEQLVRNHQERALLYSRWHRYYASSDPCYTPNLRETIELARYYHF